MCCKGLLKVMMFIFNGAIFLAGSIVLGVGVWVVVDGESFLSLLDRVDDMPVEVFQLDYLGYVLIGVGAVLLIIGFLGCCGAIKENKCMLVTFFSFLLIIFLIEVTGGVVLLVLRDKVDEILDSQKNQVREDIQQNYGKDDDMTSLWNAAMEQFDCCGYKNYTDFEGSPFNTLHGGDIYPSACCGSDSVTCNSITAGESDIPGCFVKLVQRLEDNCLIVAGMVLGIAAFEIIALVVSIVLYCNVDKKSK